MTARVTVKQRAQPHATLILAAAELLEELAVVQLTRGRMMRCQRAAKELREAMWYLETLEGAARRRTRR